MRKISFSRTVRTAYILYSLLALFHIALIIGTIGKIIPLNIVFGGMIQSADQFILFETAAFILTAIFLFFTLIKGEQINIRRLYTFSHFFMWFLFAYFILNSVGNILAQTLFEKLMTPLSLSLALVSLRMGIEPRKRSDSDKKDS